MRNVQRILTDQELSSLQKLVLVALLSFDGPLGCCPSIDSICKRSSCSRSTVQRVLSSLIASGAIAKLAGAARKRQQYVFKNWVSERHLRLGVRETHTNSVFDRDSDCIEQLERDKARREKGHARRTR